MLDKASRLLMRSCLAWTVLVNAVLTRHRPTTSTALAGIGTLMSRDFRKEAAQLQLARITNKRTKAYDCFVLALTCLGSFFVERAN